MKIPPPNHSPPKIKTLIHNHEHYVLQLPLLTMLHRKRIEQTYFYFYQLSYRSKILSHMYQDRQTPNLYFST